MDAFEDKMDEQKAPMAGPTIKPSEKAMPTKAMADARFD
jgi:hypothetical protein